MPLTVENLSYTYNAGLPSERAALSGVSFECGEGQIVSVLGHTGSGKSTLAQHLNGLIAPQSGRVSADGDETGRSAAETRRVRRKVGLVFQYPEEQIFSDKVFDEIAFAPRNWGVPEPEIPARVREAAREAGLDEALLDASPYGLSGGQKRSVAIASVIAARPSYLVLDEPAAGLDCDAAEALLSMIKNFAASGAGVVLITHDIELALSVSDMILLLEEGRTVLFGTPEETAELVVSREVKGLTVPEILGISAALRDAGKIDKLAWSAEGLIAQIRKRKNGLA